MGNVGKTHTRRSSSASSDAAVVDPRAPRFGQSITASLLLLGVGFREPVLVATVAVVLGAAVLSRWRLDLYRVLWRRLAVPVVGPPDEREPAAPHRFAKLLGATGSWIATLLLVAGLPLLGFGVAAVVGLLAGVAAATGICIGCRLYRQVAFLRARDVV